MLKVFIDEICQTRKVLKLYDILFEKVPELVKGDSLQIYIFENLGINFENIPASIFYQKCVLEGKYVNAFFKTGEAV